MANAVLDIVGSYRQSYTSGATTTVAAASATAGHIFAMRFVNTGTGAAMRLRKLEVEFLLTTAFGAAQEVGYDMIVARSYSVSATGATAITTAANDGKRRTGYNSSAFVAAGDIRIANTGAMTAGTQTLDSLPFGRGSYWASAVGQKLGANVHDFTGSEPGGMLFATSEGFIVRNAVLMGATGVGTWKFTVEWDEVITSGTV